MAGANNRSLKAAGIPKATIQTLRVEAGGHLSLKSALGIAHERGLAVGKAHEFLAKREERHGKTTAGQTAAQDFRAKAAAGMKARAAATEKENRAALLVHRLKQQAAAYGPQQPRGQRAYARAQAIIAKHPGAEKLAGQVREAEARPFHGAETRTERVRNLVARSKAQAEKSAVRKVQGRMAQGMVQQNHRLGHGSRLKGGFVVKDASRSQVTVYFKSEIDTGARFAGKSYTYRWD